MTKRPLILVTVASILALSAACGPANSPAPSTGPSAPLTASPESSSVYSPTPTPEESASSPSLSSEAALSNTFVDAKGYKSRQVIEGLSIETETNVEDQAPGEALISVHMTGESTVTNLTKNRKMVPNFSAWATPAWKSDSAMCDEDLMEMEASKGSKAYDGSADTTGKDGKFCTLYGLHVVIPPNVIELKLEEGESKTRELTQNSRSSDILVPEEDLDEIEEAVQNPDFWLMWRNVGHSVRWNDYPKACVIVDGVYYNAVVDSTKGGEKVCKNVDTSKRPE